MFVYFIREEESDLVKIGYSDNPHKRLKELQTGQTKRLEIILSVKGGAALESTLHRAFASQRVRGEWFCLTRPQIEHAAKIAIRQTVEHRTKEYYSPGYEDVAIGPEGCFENTESGNNSSKTIGLVFQWIQRTLEKSSFDNNALLSKTRSDGTQTLYLHTPTMQKGWTVCMPERERPSDVDVRNSMKHIAPTREKITIMSATSKNERQRQARVVDLEKFKAWIEENDLDLDLDGALKTLAKIRAIK